LQRRSWETDLISNSKKIFWIPDCQELVMPELFSKRELDGRKHVYNEIITAKSKVLFSSNAALSDFKRFYPEASNAMFVVNFAVVHPSIASCNINELKIKYNISQPYFIVPNQFWVHKNHKVVLEAVVELKKQNQKFQLIFTGKENDFRAPSYTQQLKQFVTENQIEDFVSFLGFITREDQLCLLKNSVAIIQPSLFEGWSTVVEDAKALSKFILLSDIAVHKEQINENVVFFNPKNALALAIAMQSQIEKPSEVKMRDYKINNINFGLGFYQMLIQ
jgi:glycosyltransferase involved in cell wall biosynthesis